MRLDRALCNTIGLDFWTSISYAALPPYKSDHYAIFLLDSWKFGLLTRLVLLLLSKSGLGNSLATLWLYCIKNLKLLNMSFVLEISRFWAMYTRT